MKSSSMIIEIKTIKIWKQFTEEDAIHTMKIELASTIQWEKVIFSTKISEYMWDIRKNKISVSLENF